MTILIKYYLSIRTVGDVPLVRCDDAASNTVVSVYSPDYIMSHEAYCTVLNRYLSSYKKNSDFKVITYLHYAKQQLYWVERPVSTSS